MKKDNPTSKITTIKKQKKSYICPYEECKKVFTESGNLKTHIRVHTGERPFMCEYEGCGKNFVTKGHLKSHYLTHTKEKPNICKICSKRYSRIGRLRIHERAHTGEKPFVCPYDECKKAFAEKGNLNTHIRIHTGERPYQCNEKDCCMTFTTLGHLKDHIRSHKNERPYSCDICNANFLRSSTLKIHKRRHTGEKPYICKFIECHKAFSELGNLKSHIKCHKKKEEECKTRDNKGIKLPLFNNSFGQNRAAEVKEEMQPKSREMNEMISLSAIKNAEEIQEQKFTFRMPIQPMCVSSVSSPYVAMNWQRSPQTQCSFTASLNGISHPQTIFSSMSPIVITPKMETFGDFEGFFASKNVSFGESPFGKPFFNGFSPNMAGAKFNPQPPSNQKNLPNTNT